MPDDDGARQRSIFPGLKLILVIGLCASWGSFPQPAVVLLRHLDPTIDGKCFENN